ncbi:MAG: DMT family transporter [Rubritepida sp.]|nr:DMT family transporter [Rubritepida sp.]
MKGPLMLMAGIGLFGVLDANSKVLAEDYGAAQAILLRHATLLLLLVLLRAAIRDAGGPLGTQHPKLHALRAVSMLFSGVLFFIAFRHLPLADGYLIFFLAPFMTLVMAAVFLRESVPRAAWLWSGVGFSGVLIALAPQLVVPAEAGADLLFGFACALLGTLCYAINITVNRGLKGERGIARLILWPSLFGLLATAPFAAWQWVPPDPEGWLRFAVNGVLAGAATILLALAFRHGTPARLAPFEFVALPWSVALDLMVFGNTPGVEVLLGGVVVVLACVMSERAVAAAARARQGMSAGKR